MKGKGKGRRRHGGQRLLSLNVGLHSKAIRHFSKIVESCYGAPQGFLAVCYIHRTTTYKSAGRIDKSIADYNKALALEPACIPTLETQAMLLESIRCLLDCLYDLEHLKLLYNFILRNRRLPEPAWKKYNVRYREIPRKLCVLTSKIQELKRCVVAGETRGNVDYHTLIGLRTKYAM